MMLPATVVSILPYLIEEVKPGLCPSGYGLDAVEEGDLGLLKIGYAERMYYVDFDRGNIRIPVDPETIAESVVMDHIRSAIHVTHNAHPGLFWVKGHPTKEEIRQQKVEGFLSNGQKTNLNEITKSQLRWFERLVKAADDSWSRFRQHNRISTPHKLAAQRLKLKREWAEAFKPEDTIQCPFCQSFISTIAIVCASCKMPQDAAIKRLPEAAQKVVRETLQRGPINA